MRAELTTEGWFDILARGADGLTVEIETGEPLLDAALDAARVLFDSDETWTEVWVLDRAERCTAAVLTRGAGAC